MKNNRLLPALLLLATSTALAATGDPVGSEFKIDTNNGLNAPAVAMGGSGSFAVIWQGGSTSGNFGTLRMQRYDSSGVAQGSEVTTVAAQADFPAGPEAAADANGNFVVSWTNGSVDIHAWARCFNSSGTPAAAAAQMDTTAGAGKVDVAMTPDRKFVVVWSTFDNKIRGQRGHCTDSAVVKDGSEFVVTLATVVTANDLAVAIDSAGKFVVVWDAPGAGASDQGDIFARHFAADGTALSDEVVVNTTTDLAQYLPDVAMSSAGTFVVTWISQANVYTSTDVRFQRFDAADVPAKVGSETPIIATGGYDRRGPRAAMDSAGDYMIAFEKYNPGNTANYWDVWGQRFSADGSAVADAAQLNTTTANLQEYVAIGMDSDGDTVVAWESSQTNSNKDIYAQRYAGSSTGGPDTTPDAFAFVDQTGVTRSATITSAAITVSGIDSPAAISVTGGMYSINGAAFTSAAGTVSNNDQVRAQHTASAEYATITNTVVTIGGVSDTFSSTTESAPVPDTTPNAFSFTDVTLADPGTQATSNAITVSGINTTTEISVTGGEYSIDGGSFVTSGGSVSNGQTVEVRVTAGTFDALVEATVNIGGVSDTFSVQTRAATEDSTADANGHTVGMTADSGTIENMQPVTTPAFAPSGYQFANGFFSFDIACPGGTPGCTVVVTLTLPVGAAPTSYIKCDASACSVFTGTSITGNVVTLTLTDGGDGDSDGLADGTITDPGAPATTYSSGGGGGGYGGGGALDWTWLLVMMLARPLRAAARRRSAR